MISAFEIYLVMQLDSIVTVFFVFAVASGFVALFLGFIGAAEDNPVWLAFAKRLCVWSVASSLLAAFVPSTKTAAAMLVIPAIANSEAAHKEAGELYVIAKQALKDIASPEEKKD
jgi:hypothetical protein